MIEFIEKDGQLFRKVGPYPLKENTPMPCLVQLIQDDSPMGRFNNELEASKDRVGNIYTVSKHEKHIDYVFYTRFEVIAEHCPEGSVHWALWQMRQGKQVKGKCNLVFSLNFPLTEKSFITSCAVFEPFAIYEPEPQKSFAQEINKIAEMIKLEKPRELIMGHWYITFAGNYVQYSRTRSGNHLIRHAGNEHYAEAQDKLNDSTYFGASLEPDFSNAKEGDKVFHSRKGACAIVLTNWAEGYPVVVVGQAYAIDGRYINSDEHPALFHNFEHFIAYHKEAEYQRKRGEK